MGTISQSTDRGQDGLTEFIGLLYSRYSDPISFLNIGHETVGIFQTVLQVYIDKNNQQLWDLYLHFKPKKSFRDWKNSIGVSNALNTLANRQYGTKNEQETKEIINKSDSILRGFKPKNKCKKGR